MSICHVLKKYRESGRSQSRLFLTVVKPFKPAHKSTIARWIKTLIHEAGVDDHFGAHSVQGASTTAATMQGMSVADVMKVADWSSDSTFKTFYYRPMQAPLKSLFTSLTRKWYNSLYITLFYHFNCLSLVTCWQTDYCNHSVKINNIIIMIANSSGVSIMYRFGLSFEQHIVIFAAGSSEVQFMILQGSARPEVRSELYEELKARIWHYCV